ncbi:fumarylacetoacetate hydrolase family protein [Streptomyces sp. NPDC094034]|uniref:fumarylacetoacetate hydrolase family protein n=1 Tax=Streptomyces sp. NPDC094034 TaxID=3155309 RepID=UPI00331BEFD3
MRWVSFRVGGDGPQRTGVLDGGTVRALDPGMTLLALLQDGRLDEAGENASRSPAEVFAVDEIVLLPPIPRPPSLRSGLCFLDHLRNCRRVLGDDSDLGALWTDEPAFYFSSPAAVIGPTEDVAVPPGCAWFDLELEVAAVLGRPGRDVSVREAESCIAGYTLMCDWSARDFQSDEMRRGLGLAKTKDCATTLGPALVTPDEFAEFGGLAACTLSAQVDGRTLTTGRTADMDWTFAELIAYASRGSDLVAGDVLSSGTVPGGCLLEHLDRPPAEYSGWLRPGNEVVLEGDVLGRTCQRIVRGDRPGRSRK